MVTPISRRAALSLIAAPAVFGMASKARAQTKTLKISHQFPSSSGDSGDFRDRLCRRFAADVEKRTNGALKFEIYPNSSLMKTFAQFSALRKGAIDFSLYPTSYAGGEIPELNLTFMPAIVTTYQQAFAWKPADIGQELARLLDGKGVKIITWVWQSGGIAGRRTLIVRPADTVGLKVRGGSREMDVMFKAAGAAVTTMPSNELYIAMQTGAVDAAVTSSTSMMSFKLQELSKHLTSAGGRSFFFVFEPLLMSKLVFDTLSKDEQQALMEAGAQQEAFGLQAAIDDDKAMEQTFSKAGATVQEMDQGALQQWADVAAGSSWKDFAATSKSCESFLQMAQKLAA